MVSIARYRGSNSSIYAVVLLSFAWNLLLLIGVVLNLDFAHTRAAGGQFTDFPIAVRVLYIFLCALIVYQVRLFVLIFNKRKVGFDWLPRFFVVIGFLGVLVNAISRSANERWNVIPGAIITWAFWNYGVKRRNSDLEGVDLFPFSRKYNLDMGNMKQCQSCGMPLVSKRQGDMRGIEIDGTLSEKWCKLCYKDGHFTGPDCTLEEMIEIVDNALKQQKAWFGLRWMARNGIPRLERWR